MIWYSCTIFLSAFLLFAVQPLMGKFILPWFGGGAGIWTVCLLFFQCVLLVGYCYAHLVSSRLSVKKQVLLHIAALAISVLLLPIAPDSSWKPMGSEDPTRTILFLLAVHVGVPFALLAATGPLLSRWFSHSFAGRLPWRLYALSNAGSLLALITYPFIVEPFLALPMQVGLWSLGYGVFVLACAGCAWRFSRAGKSIEAESFVATEFQLPSDDSILEPGSEPSPRNSAMLLWLVLAAVASVMLLATTRQISQDLAVIPLLWVLPLAIYLLSFILCFGHDRWYRRWTFMPLLVVGTLAVAYIMSEELTLNIWIQISTYSLTLFAACMVCHGELVRLKPGAHHLTRFYLVVGAGGALGGILVAVVATYFFNDLWEYHLGLLASCFLAAIFVLRYNPPKCAVVASSTQIPKVEEARKLDGRKKRRRKNKKILEQKSALTQPHSSWIWGGAVVLLLTITVVLAWNINLRQTKSFASSRSFFGVTHILHTVDNIRIMEHGRTIHGAQSPNRSGRKIPTTYYERDSGLGIALAEYRRLQNESGNTGNDALGTDGPIEKSLRIGAIGLGVGTIAALVQTGDNLRFYEIDPNVERLAREYFTYLDDSAAAVDIVLGDARIMLEHEAQKGEFQNFDVLVVDAFNSDAVPMHLLTREAMRLYAAHLNPRGLVAFHVTNRHLNLGAVVRGLAVDADQEALRLSTVGSGPVALSADWVFVTKNPAFLESETIRLAATEWVDTEPLPILWTDEYASLWSAVLATEGEAIGKWESAPNSGRFAIDRAHLIEPADIRKIRNLGRKLYHETAGETAIVVTTVPGRPTIRGEMVPPMAYLEKLYADYALDRPGKVTGILLLVSVADDLTFIRLPEGWPDNLREQILKVVSTMMFEGTAVSDFSDRLVRGIEAIDLLIRNFRSS